MLEVIEFHLAGYTKVGMAFNHAILNNDLLTLNQMWDLNKITHFTGNRAGNSNIILAKNIFLSLLAYHLSHIM
jgi:hypothetical protein